MRTILFALLIFVASAPGRAQDLDKPVFVVAAERLGGFYRGAVMIAVPVLGSHVGLILNRPTKVRLADLFPEHEPSRKVNDPIYLGGPINTDMIGALVRSEHAPGPGAIRFAPGVWFVLQAIVVDAIIEATPNEARYFAGFVIWKSGELAQEVRGGMMSVRPADPAKLFLPDTSNLYYELAPPRGRLQES